MCTLRLFEGLGDDKWSLLRAVVKRNFVPAEAAKFKVSLELKSKLCKRDGVKNVNKTSLKHHNKSVAFTISKVWVEKVRARTHTCDVRSHMCVCVRNEL